MGLIEKCLPIPGISEHEFVYGELSLTVKIQTPARRTVYMWWKADFNKIRQHSVQVVLTFSDVDLLWERKRLYNLARRTGTTRDWENCKKMIQKNVEEPIMIMVLKMTNLGSNTGSKQFWFYIKSQWND